MNLRGGISKNFCIAALIVPVDWVVGSRFYYFFPDFYSADPQFRVFFAWVEEQKARRAASE
jgi:hypothetical protein